MKIYVLGLVKVKKVALEVDAGIVTIQKVNVLVNVIKIKTVILFQNVYQKQSAASLRSSGGKKAIANAVKEKEKMILTRTEKEI